MKLESLPHVTLQSSLQINCKHVFHVLLFHFSVRYRTRQPSFRNQPWLSLFLQASALQSVKSVIMSVSQTVMCYLNTSVCSSGQKKTLKISSEPVTKIKQRVQFILFFTNINSFPLSATKVAKHVLSLLSIGFGKSTD